VINGARSLILCASFIAAIFLSGCSVDTSTEKSMDGGLFSEVQIIGTRGVGVGEFNKPRSVALDRDDNLYVVDMTGRVQKFSPDGHFQLQWQMPQTDLGKPKGMGMDKDGNIIVIEPHYQRINIFSPQGKLVSQWGQKGTNAGQLIMPRAVAVNSRGDFLMPEYTVVDRVQEFTPGGKSLVRLIGKPGTAPGEFNRPEGIAVDAADTIYVADSCNHRIQIFSPDGKWLRSFGTAGTGPGELSYPYDVKVDKQGNIFVCEFENSRIQIFDAAGHSVQVIGCAGAAPGQFSNPYGIALDSHGNLYVADSMNHRVQKFIRRQEGNSHAAARRCQHNLEEVAQQSPRLPLLGYLGYEQADSPTSKRLRLQTDAQPLRGCDFFAIFPKVAPSSQPWALLQNPFGIHESVVAKNDDIELFSRSVTASIGPQEAHG
jgi:sugar lactone lactonase YvrE